MYGIITVFCILIGCSLIIISFLTNDNTVNRENETSSYDEENINDINKKILEINEYSEFIKGELDNKHKELLFLYQMINDKSKELKETKGTDGTNGTQHNNEEKEETIENKNRDKKVEFEGTQHSNKQIEERNKSVEHNNNKIILDLVDKGYDTQEIAKMLDLGEGEVRFVLNLYK